MDIKTFVFKENEESYYELEKILSSKLQVKLDFQYKSYNDFPQKLKKLLKKYREEVNLSISNEYNLQKVIDSCIDASPLKIYNLILEEGTYNVMNLRTKDWVNLCGKTSQREKYRIVGRQKDGTKYCVAYETIIFQSTSELRNLTITCRNMRYPIHSDVCSAGTEQRIINCHIEHLGNWISDGSRLAEFDECWWTSCHAYGCGTSSGMRIYIEGCTLIARKYGAALYAHNNANFGKPSIIFCANSNIIQADGGPAVFMSSLGSQKKDACYLYNNYISGPIFIEDIPWLGKEKENHSEWLIRGKENSYSFFYNGISKKEGLQYKYGKLDHYIKLRNSSDKVIKKGMACCFKDGTNEIKIMSNKDSLKMFAGIAAENIQVGRTGYLQYCGEISQDDILIEDDKYLYKQNLGVSNNNEGIFGGNKRDILLRYTKEWVWANKKINIYKIV